MVNTVMLLQNATRGNIVSGFNIDEKRSCLQS